MNGKSSRYTIAIALLAVAVAFGMASPRGTLAQDGTPAATMAAMGPAATAEPGKDVSLTLLPKFVGIAVFAEADAGAQEAATELKATGKYQMVGPDKADVQSQIEFIKSLTTQGTNVIMISANDKDAVVPALKDARDKGIKIVGWDSPPAPDGRDIFISQVDFSTAGQVMADMALNILGDEGGQFAILSATSDAANQNAWIESLKETLKTDPKYAKLELVDTVYGNDDSEKSYNEAQGLVDKYPDLKLIMAPTTVGIAAAAKAMQDGDMCDTVKVSGLGLSSEMASYIKNGCSPEFALWSFQDLGYLTYYTGYMLATGAIKGVEGEMFVAGRMGTYTIQKGSDGGLYILMGPFTVFNADNIDKYVAPAATMEATASK
jgi:rhamnose transport system substrate-binding protein